MSCREKLFSMIITDNFCQVVVGKWSRSFSNLSPCVTEWQQHGCSGFVASSADLAHAPFTYLSVLLSIYEFINCSPLVHLHFHWLWKFTQFKYCLCFICRHCTLASLHKTSARQNSGRNTGRWRKLVFRSQAKISVQKFIFMGKLWLAMNYAC